METASAFVRVAWLRAARATATQSPRPSGVVRGTAAVLMPLFHALAAIVLGLQFGAASRSSPDARTWAILGAFLMAAASVASAEFPLPGVRAPQASLLAHPLLLPLPVASWIRPWIALASQPIHFLFPITILIGAADRSVRGWLAATLLGCLAVMAGAYVGMAATRVARATLPRRWARVWPGLMLSVGACGACVMLLAACLGAARGPAKALMLASRALTGSSMSDVALGLLIPFPILALFAGCVLIMAERLAQDRIELAPRVRTSCEAGLRMQMADVERLMSSRDFARPAVVIGVQVAALALSFLGAVCLEPKLRALGEERHSALRTLCILVAWTVSCLLTWLMTTRAARCVARDQVARPLLATLPIEPRELLQGKTASMRALVLPFLATLLPWAIALPSGLGLELVWRLGALVAAFWLAAAGAVSVTFLRQSANRGQSASWLNIETLLLMTPLSGVVMASSLPAALLGLVVLGAVSSEARRACQRAVRWIDDAGDGVDRDTEVWRAMLVFGVFSVFGGIGGALLVQLAPDRAVGAALGMVLVSQVLLCAQTLSRKGLDPQLPSTAKGWRRTAIAPLAGLISVAAAAGYAALLRRFHIDLPDVPAWTGMSRAVWLAVTLVGAPMAEEVFFRGWVQPALQRELPLRSRHVALVLTAVMFASIHGPAGFVPVLVLGLLTGGMRVWTGGVVAGIVAHVVHNAFAVGLF